MNKSNIINRLNIARLCLIASIIASRKNLGGTFGHVGSESFSEHAWFHFFREGFGDVAAVVILLILLFGSKKFRTPQTWILGLVVCAGYYLPFWIGYPFNSALISPSVALPTHISMAVLAIASLFIAKREFTKSV